MKNKEFLNKYPLELVVYHFELDRVRRLLKKANESYVLSHTERTDGRIGKAQRYIFSITCPTTDFAMGYYRVGVMMGPLITARMKKLFPKQHGKKR